MTFRAAPERQQGFLPEAEAVEVRPGHETAGLETE